MSFLGTRHVSVTGLLKEAHFVVVLFCFSVCTGIFGPYRNLHAKKRTFSKLSKFSFKSVTVSTAALRLFYNENPKDLSFMLLFVIATEHLILHISFFFVCLFPFSKAGRRINMLLHGSSRDMLCIYISGKYFTCRICFDYFNNYSVRHLRMCFTLGT